MNNVASIKPKHPKLTEVNNARVLRGLPALDDLHEMWELSLTPLLTLQDLANGSQEVKKIAQAQQPALRALREANKAKGNASPYPPEKKAA